MAPRLRKTGSTCRYAALDDAVALGFERILTSGGAATALQGAAKIKELHERASGRIGVMAGGGVRAANAVDVPRRTGSANCMARLPS